MFNSQNNIFMLTNNRYLHYGCKYGSVCCIVYRELMINDQFCSINETLLQTGLLTSVVQELCDLVGELNTGDYGNSSVSVTDLEVELHRAQEAVDRMTKDLESKTEDLKKNGETIMDLTGKVCNY